MNFECSNVESNLIKQCIIDTLTQAVAQENRANSRGTSPGMKPLSEAESYNQQFNLNANNNQFFVQKKSKLQSSNQKTQATIKVEAIKSGLAELDMPEIEDY